MIDPKIKLPVLFAVIFLQTAFAGKCTTPFTCMQQSQCQALHENHGILPVLFRCSLNGRSRLVCCPPVPQTENDFRLTVQNTTVAISSTTTQASSSSLSVIETTTEEEISVDLKLHKNYRLLPNVCGIGLEEDPTTLAEIDITSEIFTDHKVVDGKNARVGAFPWMALLFFHLEDEVTGKKSKPWPKCGGTLISPRYVLTAAHCFSEVKEKIKYARLGEHDYRIKCTPTRKNCPHNIPIEKIILHESYNETTIKNDIALLRLKRNAIPTENPYIAPICLPFDTIVDTSPNRKFIVAGWGKLNKKAKVGSEILQSAEIRPTGSQCPTCPKDRPSALRICPLSETLQLCIQVFRKKSPCQGDSGGPLMILSESNRMVQAGVVSVMPGGCGETGIPAIYTRVDGYLTWILDNIEP